MTGTRSDVGMGVKKIKGKPLVLPVKPKVAQHSISAAVGFGVRQKMIEQGLIIPGVDEVTEEQKDGQHSDCY